MTQNNPPDEGIKIAITTEDENQAAEAAAEAAAAFAAEAAAAEAAAENTSESASEAQPASSESSEAAESAAEPDLATQLSELEGKYLRTLAEYENYRKRVAREIQDASAAARGRTIKEILDVYDLLKMAVEYAAKATDMAALQKGVEMTFGEFKKTLDTLGVKPIEAVGQPFDPQLHEALSTQKSETVPEGVVLQQWKTGFKLGEKLLRASSVIISAGPETPAAESASAEPPPAPAEP